ncbi:hypothetical protein Y032_0273g983 [Ancylostoma ceylanicum]|uniref:Uncharacterized protein n=1 Tax=Ancylostoma ceylanicum TaxID=53326 RepID=A0A016S811_9BILA|nr:hypothetical protein Y032_0273g983 [Ancylostoma ceylanicum]
MELVDLETLSGNLVRIFSADLVEEEVLTGDTVVMSALECIHLFPFSSILIQVSHGNIGQAAALTQAVCQLVTELENPTSVENIRAAERMCTKLRKKKRQKPKKWAILSTKILKFSAC